MNYGIGNVKDKSKSLFTTTTAPTESGGVITLATTDIVENGFKVDDYLAYVDNGNISALYSISVISSGTATLSLVGNVGGGGGKQLYQHNITLGSTNNFVVKLQITNDNNTLFDTWSKVAEYLDSKGFNDANGSITKCYMVSGYSVSANLHYIGVQRKTNENKLMFLGENGVFTTITYSNDNAYDTVITL